MIQQTREGTLRIIFHCDTREEMIHKKFLVIVNKRNNFTTFSYHNQQVQQRSISLGT